MAFAPSTLNIAPLCVETEGNFYGTFPAASGNYGVDPTLVPSDDGINTYDSPVPFQVVHGTQDLNIHRGTPTRLEDIIGTIHYQIDFQMPWQGGATGATAPRFIDVLTCSGLYGAAVSGTPTTYAIRPASQAEYQSATMACEYNGWVHEANGIMGNLIVRGRAGEAVTAAFSGLGKYQAPVAGTMNSVYSSNHAGGDLNATAFYNVAGSIKPAGGTAYNFCLVDFELNMNNRVAPILCANDSGSRGIGTMYIMERNPSLRVTFQLDTDSTTGCTYANIFAHLTATTTHEIRFTYTDLNSIAHLFTFPTAQVRNPNAVAGDGVRQVTIDYKLQSSTAQGEFQITQS